MSLAPKEIPNTKRLAQMGSGTHCAMIADLFYLQNAAKKDILANGKYKIMAVRFKDGQNRVHEQHYVIDGAWRQNNFKKMLSTAQVIPSEGTKPMKKDAIGKRLWISVNETHYMDDGVIVNDLDGNAKIEYHIFKVSPYIDGGKKPAIVGDPSDNPDGQPMGLFIQYKNVSMDEPTDEKPVPVVPVAEKKPTPLQQSEASFLNQKPEPKEERWDEEPTF